MPSARHSQVSPPSRVSHTPPHDMPIRTVALSRGSTQIEWIAGQSVPPPIHCWRFGLSHSERTSSHVAPWSRERKSPPGMVPHHSDALLLRAAGLEREDVDEIVGDVLAPAVAVDEAFGLRRIGRRGDLLPDPVFPPMQLDAEMAVVEHGVVAAAAAVVQRQSDVVAEKIGIGDAPAAVAAFDPKQTLAGRHDQPVAHIRRPPLPP